MLLSSLRVFTSTSSSHRISESDYLESSGDSTMSHQTPVFPLECSGNILSFPENTNVSLVWLHNVKYATVLHKFVAAMSRLVSVKTAASRPVGQKGFKMLVTELLALF